MKNLLFTTALILSGCTWNVAYVKQQAPAYLKAQGYEIVAYEGYETSGPFCGGYVWYEVKRSDSPIVYQLALCKWGNELHMYNVKNISNQVQTND
jgi:hypothetical protein